MIILLISECAVKLVTVTLYAIQKNKVILKRVVITCYWYRYVLCIPIKNYTEHFDWTDMDTFLLRRPLVAQFTFLLVCCVMVLMFLCLCCHFNVHEFFHKSCRVLEWNSFTSKTKTTTKKQPIWSLSLPLHSQIQTDMDAHEKGAWKRLKPGEKASARGCIRASASLLRFSTKTA